MPITSSPVTPRVRDVLTEVLDELDVAGGELVITSLPADGDCSWSVQVLTDPRGEQQSCAHGAGAESPFLDTALEHTLTALRRDQRR